MLSSIDGITLQVMWDRLIALVEEQAQALLRTAFSPIVRESGDLSAGVFDTHGRMMAQAVTGTPGHVNAMAESVAHFLAVFPPAMMIEGDVYATNDPWIGTGHLYDMVVVTPVFRDGALVALFASTSHLIDIGGIGFGPDARDVFEEGLCLPIMRVMEAGQRNESFFGVLRTNSRYPTEAEGDVLSLVAGNRVGAGRLLAMMGEFSLSSIDELADHIIGKSRALVESRIRSLAAGRYAHAVTLDGFERPVTLQAAVDIADTRICVDFTGTSGTSARGINVPFSYAYAYATYGIRILVAPDVPNNAGSLAPITITAPVGCILNAQRPAPVASRHIVGQMLPDLLFGCLAQVPGIEAPAEGASCLWNLILESSKNDRGPAAEAHGMFSVLAVQTGGVGARPDSDGLSATAFPSGVTGVSVEIIETLVPLVFLRKELRPDSGGAGCHRGGLGQIIEVRSRNATAFDVLAAFDRIDNPARGRAGGKEGSPGRLSLSSGMTLRGKGRQTVPPGETLIVMTPGGGGYGDPAARSFADIESDIRLGLVSGSATAAG